MVDGRSFKRAHDARTRKMSVCVCVRVICCLSGGRGGWRGSPPNLRALGIAMGQIHYHVGSDRSRCRDSTALCLFLVAVVLKAASFGASKRKGK